MVRRLEIENVGLIARAEIAFADGATIFTGETGSGKTMLLGALGFVLGSRVGADIVRRGSSKAAVTLTFDPDRALRERLAADGFELDPGEEASIAREMSENGRSSVRVNGRAATAAYVREIADAVAEIVGQHEAQRLVSPAYHRDLLDRFSGEAAMAARGEVARLHAHAENLRGELERVQADERAAHAQYENACYVAREIEQANAQPGEDERLEQRRRYLDNVERIAAALQTAHDALADEDRGATGSLGAASAALSHVATMSDPLRAFLQQASALQSEANDLAAALARELAATEFDSAELEAINARLDLLDRIKRKYGGSIERALETMHDAAAVCEEYEGRGRRTAELAAAVAAAAGELGAAAAKLTELRKKASKALAKRMAHEFADLALAAGRFDVSIEPAERIGPDGAERVEFLFAANAGEPLRPLAKIASGGELSRLLLALVVALAGARGSSSALVFDEIDAGVGGATATAVGARIGQLANGTQVLCVTHLAQIATWAGRHYVLDKTESKGETVISVREIAGAAQREAEIARMLSGESHDAAINHARALLQARS
jgi:DNA repair protein RecN (Recombination protein N)